MSFQWPSVFFIQNKLINMLFYEPFLIDAELDDDKIVEYGFSVILPCPYHLEFYITLFLNDFYTSELDYS